MSYQLGFFRNDILAGITLGIVLIPQAVAYASIAGLPPIYGLYTALIPTVIYAFLGSSPKLATGPVAMDSLLLAAGLAGLSFVGSHNYGLFAVALTFLIGAWQILFALCRLGFLVNFLSKPIINGFTTAVALLIGFSQLPPLLGAGSNRGDTLQEMVYHSAGLFNDISGINSTIGFAAIFGLLAARFLNKRIPGALLVVAVGICVVYGFDLIHAGVTVVGNVPSGLPGPSLGFMAELFQNFQSLAIVAAPIALISFMEASSISRALAKDEPAQNRKQKPNKELWAFGLGNIVGAVFGAYVSSGSFSRSALSKNLGGKTNLAGLVSAITVGLVLILFSDIFLYLPKSLLAAIIIVAVTNLVDFEYPRYLWRTKRDECFLLLMSFATTAFWGVLEGLTTGIALSLLLLVYRTTKPHYAVLGRIPGTTDYRNTERFADLDTRPDILAVRFDDALYYANVDYFISTIDALMQKRTGVRLVVLHCVAIRSIDATALEQLDEFISRLKADGIVVYFAALIGPIRDYLKRVGFFHKVGENHFFLEVQAAIDYYDDNYCDPGHFDRSRQSN